jgi:hypothetical protein
VHLEYLLQTTFKQLKANFIDYRRVYNIGEHIIFLKTIMLIFRVNIGIVYSYLNSDFFQNIGEEGTTAWNPTLIGGPYC